MESHNELSRENALILESFVWGEPINGMSMACLVFEDGYGKKMFCLVGCKPNYQDSIHRAFQRLIGVRPPQVAAPIPDLIEKPKSEEGVERVPERRTYEQTKEDFPGLLTEEQKHEEEEGRVSDTPSDLPTRDYSQD